MRLTFILLIIITTLVSGCYKESDYDKVKLLNYDTTLHVFADLPNIPADTVSFSRIFVELPYDADSNKTTVTIKTDLGFFLESGSQLVQVKASQNSDSLKRIAIATLRSGTRTGIAHIQASFYTQNVTLQDSFYNAYPDYILFSASTLSIKPQNDAGGEVSFVCKLFKNLGSPSQSNIVSLKVVDSTFEPIGSFRYYNSLSDASGVTQFVYVLGDSVANGRKFTGKLYAITSVHKDQIDLITDTIKLISSP